MKTCPHCGGELPQGTGRIGTDILSSFFEEYGGQENGITKLGRDMANELQEAKGHTKVLMQGRVLNLVESEDKARARRQEIEEFTQQQERAIVMEQGLYWLEHDEEFFERYTRAAEKRGLVVLKATHLIEAQTVEQ